METKPADMAIMPHMQNISGKISRLLAKRNIKMIHHLVKKSSNLLRLAEDSLGYNVLGIYCILYACVKVYAG